MNKNFCQKLFSGLLEFHTYYHEKNPDEFSRLVEKAYIHCPSPEMTELSNIYSYRPSNEPEFEKIQRYYHYRYMTTVWIKNSMSWKTRWNYFWDQIRKSNGY